MSSKTSIRRKRDEAAGKVRVRQSGITVSTPPRSEADPGYSSSWVAQAFARNRAELNRPTGGALHYTPNAA